DINEQGLQSAAREIANTGATVSHVRAADISDHDAIVALASEIHDQHPSMDVVMNIAGVSTWGTIDRLEHRDWKRMIDINLMGPIGVLERFLPPMIQAGRGGHVVNVSSAAGLLGLPWHAAYSASKFGLRGVSEVLRFDLARHHIGVSLVCPGAVSTPLVETVQIIGVDRQSPAVEKLIASFQKHAVTPEHVAKKIIQGIERDRYVVFTSPDIRLAHWCQRKFAPSYEFAMRSLNDRIATTFKHG
ncbi:MAG TPA: SDR family oxidoreductase, partial [Solirubrobacteraceae bacterium]